MSSAQHHHARAVIQDTDGLVTFIQIWDVTDAAAQSAWLSIMHGNIDVLRAKPGFISMTLHSSVDGKRIAVYDRMAQIGTPDGTLYNLDRVYAATA